MDDNSALILTELREFRAAVTGWQQDMGERVASLEVQVKAGITGNGQPSRLTTVEKELSALQRWKYWLMGVAAAVSAAVHYVLPRH